MDYSLQTSPGDPDIKDMGKGSLIANVPAHTPPCWIQLDWPRTSRRQSRELRRYWRALSGASGEALPEWGSDRLTLSGPQPICTRWAESATSWDSSGHQVDACVLNTAPGRALSRCQLRKSARSVFILWYLTTALTSSRGHRSREAKWPSQLMIKDWNCELCLETMHWPATHSLLCKWGPNTLEQW